MNAATSVVHERVGRHISLITIARPERRNTVDGATARALEQALEEFEADTDSRVAVIAGRGATFCAGRDPAAMASGEGSTIAERDPFAFTSTRPSKPLIAAVEGDALGGGFELCLACDLIVASSTTQMGLSDEGASRAPLGGGLFRLPKRMPFGLAMELALTGEAKSAAFFAQWGLINRVVEPGLALDTALSLAAKISAAEPRRVRASTQIVRQSYDWTDADAWRRQQELAGTGEASYAAASDLFFLQMQVEDQ